MLQQKLTYCIHLLLNPYFEPHTDLQLFNPFSTHQTFDNSIDIDSIDVESTQTTPKNQRIKRFLGGPGMFMLNSIQGIMMMIFGGLSIPTNNQYPTTQPPAMYPQHVNMYSYPFFQQTRYPNPYQQQTPPLNNYNVPLTTAQLHGILQLIMRQHNPTDVFRIIDHIQATRPPIPPADAVANAELLSYMANNQNQILNNFHATTNALQANNSSLNELLSLRDKRDVDFRPQLLRSEKQAEQLFTTLLQAQFPQFATLNSSAALIFHVLNGGTTLNFKKLDEQLDLIKKQYVNFHLPNFEQFSDQEFFIHFITVNAQFLTKNNQNDSSLPSKLKLPLSFLRKMYDYLKEKSSFTKMIQNEPKNFQQNLLINLHNSFVQGNRLATYLNDVEFEKSDPKFTAWFKRATNLFTSAEHKNDILDMYTPKLRTARSNPSGQMVNLQKVIANYLKQGTPRKWQTLTISPTTLENNKTLSILTTIMNKITTQQLLLIIGFSIMIIMTGIIIYASYQNKLKHKRPNPKIHLEMSRIDPTPAHTEEESQELNPENSHQ